MKSLWVLRPAAEYSFGSCTRLPNQVRSRNSPCQTRHDHYFRYPTPRLGPRGDPAPHEGPLRSPSAKGTGRRSVRGSSFAADGRVARRTIEGTIPSGAGGTPHAILAL